MGKRRNRKNPIVTASNQKLTIGKFVFNDVSPADLVSIATLAGTQHTLDLIIDILVVIVTVYIMAQLRLSTKNEARTYLDNKPSYSRYKRNVVLSVPGRIVSTLRGLFKAAPAIGKSFNEQMVVDLTQSYSQIPIPNAKRLASPSSSNWQAYLAGEMSSLTGQLLSCPSTNISLFNLNEMSVKTATLESIIDQFKQECASLPEFEQYKDYITPEAVAEHLTQAMLLDSGGFSVEKLVFSEPTTIKSSLEEQIFGGLIVRNGTVSTVLGLGGLYLSLS